MNIDITLIHSIGKIAVAIIVLLAFFLLTVKSRIKKSNFIFSLFLLLVAFDLCGLFIYEWLNHHPLIDVFRRTVSLLQMPLVYFYVQSICYQDFKINLSLLKHGIFYIAGLLLFVPRFAFFTTVEQSQLLNDPQTIELIIKNIIGEIQYFVYVFLIFKTLANYKKLYQENYASYDSTAYVWLFQMTIISLVAHVFSLTKDFMILYANSSLVLVAHLVISIIVLLVICWLVLKTLYHPSIARGISFDQKPIASNKKDNTLDNPISEDVQLELDELNKFMEKHKPYMEPDLTIESLAEMHGMESKDLSTLINYHLGQNFFNFINTHRINKAKIILKNPNQKTTTILQVLYEVGFNSKSSFNTAFKKYTGQTPSAYRKSFNN